jgi:hypothetical protein
VSDASVLSDSGIEVLQTTITAACLFASSVVYATSIVTNGRHVFGVGVANGQPALCAVPVDGGPSFALFSAMNDGLSPSVATDGLNVYACMPAIEDVGGDLYRVPAAGGAVETLASAKGAIATDGKNVYFLGNSDIESVPIGGGAITTLSSTSYYDDAEVAVNPYFGHIAADGHRVYWTESRYHTVSDVPPGTTAIYSVPANGGPVTALATFGYLGQQMPQIVTDGVNVYWLAYAPYDDGGVVSGAPRYGGSISVQSVPVDGGPVTTLASADDAVDASVTLPRSLATDGVNVYFTAASGIMRVPVAGGSPTMFAAGVESSELENGGTDTYGILAVDDANVYWVSPIGNSYGPTPVLFKKAKGP